MSKVVLITGGSDGLGRAAARVFLLQGFTVVITGRTEEKLAHAKSWITRDLNQELHNQLHTIILDLADKASIHRALDDFKALNIPLHILINNAGASHRQPQKVMDASGKHSVELSIYVNAIAGWYFTLLLIPLFEEPLDPAVKCDKRILFVSSSIHDPAARGGKGEAKEIRRQDLSDISEYDGHRYYKISKLCQLWLAYLLGERLAASDIQVLAFSPGFVPTTGLTRQVPWVARTLMKTILPWMSFTRSETESAEDYLFYATSDQIQKKSKVPYYRFRKETESSADSYNMEKAKTFWNLACDLCDLPDHYIQ